MRVFARSFCAVMMALAFLVPLIPARASDDPVVACMQVVFEPPPDASRCANAIGEATSGGSSWGSDSANATLRLVRGGAVPVISPALDGSTLIGGNPFCGTPGLSCAPATTFGKARPRVAFGPDGAPRVLHAVAGSGLALER